jgi:hypothetical protein
MGRTRFVALEGKIKADLAMRPFKKAVYVKYQAALGISYRQFLYYVKELERGVSSSKPPLLLPAMASEATPPAGEWPGRSQSSESKPSSVREPINARAPKPKTFVFNPANIDLKKLI